MPLRITKPFFTFLPLRDLRWHRSNRLEVLWYDITIQDLRAYVLLAVFPLNCIPITIGLFRRQRKNNTKTCWKNGLGLLETSWRFYIIRIDVRRFPLSSNSRCEYDRCWILGFSSEFQAKVSLSEHVILWDNYHDLFSVTQCQEVGKVKKTWSARYLETCLK